jgi:pilus assembly protein FimV
VNSRLFWYEKTIEIKGVVTMQVKKIVSGVSAAMLLMCYASAFGAGLGKIWVNSKLGQPLSADVELIVPDSAELKSLHARMGSADAFNQANLEMTSALESVHFTIHSKPDGSMFVHLSSEKPITDPFLDMIIELDWRNGQLLREYTLLLDPVDMPSAPNLTVAPAVVSAAPVAAQAISPSMPVATVNMPPAATSRPAPRQRPTPSTSTPTSTSASTSATSPVQNVGTETLKTVKVRRGVTLSSIAIQHQPVGVHLDQMLVGLYRENTQAFDGNMNRMKVGQVLRIPTRDTLTAISEVAAAREIHLQAEDWHNYRQKLAGQVEHATVKKSGANEISGNVIAAVQQKTPAPVAGADVLKLSHAGTSKVMPSGTANSQSALAEQKRMNQDDVAASKKALE